MIAKIHFVYILRFIFKHKVYSLFKVISLCSGLISAIILWLYTVEYNQQITSLGDLFAKCAFIDMLSILAIVLVMCAAYFLILYSQRKLRSNEILVRRLYGGNGGAIAYGLMLETFLFVAFSFFISLVIIDQLIPVLNYMTNKEVWIRGAVGYRLGIFILLFLVVVEILCGVLPAYLYSRIRPLDILAKKDLK